MSDDPRRWRCWNINGCSELQVLEYADGTLGDPILLPNLVVGELSISAMGSMVAMTVQGPDMPRTVEPPPTPTIGWPAASTPRDAGAAELIAWDGTRVAAILTGEDGVGQSTLIDPVDGHRVVVDRRSGGGGWSTPGRERR